MAFKENLIATTKSDASAYMQFISGHMREGFSTYAFVEDDDDMVFYQHALHEQDAIGYLSCGGKENVINVYKRLQKDGLAGRLLFFVDRDTEQTPFEFSDEVCRTELYSWESYVFQEDALSRIASRRFRPSLTASQRNEVAEAWRQTVERYRDVLCLHTALTRAAKSNNVSLGMRHVVLARDAQSEGMIAAPAESVKQEVVGKIQHAVSLGIKETDIDKFQSFYKEADLLHASRGKSLFQIFRLFLSTVEKFLGRKFYGDYNSPLILLASLPNAYAPFDFIRIYVDRRLSEKAELA
ncbi:DUF4435 domain-containing protein [Sphingomonadaceae bacterium OTU29LAMAA1]|nr:DUF4435 domain-containing protein [Sphingomonadaceae bacterium OTU29LAMAA1]